jgi:cytoskeletal protein RodZ
MNTDELIAKVKERPLHYATYLILIIILFIFILLPAWKGYWALKEIEKQDVPEEYILNLGKLNDDYEECSEELVSSKNQAARATTDLLNCQNTSQTQQAAATTQIGTLTTQVTQLTTDLTTTQATLATATAKASADASIIADAARRLCCARRIDDPSISGYTTSNNRIECVATGGMNISC